MQEKARGLTGDQTSENVKSRPEYSPPRILDIYEEADLIGNSQYDVPCQQITNVPRLGIANLPARSRNQS